jgi:hypothetical protein
MAESRVPKAFSSESLPWTWPGVETGSRWENALDKPPFRFNRSEKAPLKLIQLGKQMLNIGISGRDGRKDRATSAKRLRWE